MVMEGSRIPKAGALEILEGNPSNREPRSATVVTAMPPGGPIRPLWLSQSAVEVWEAVIDAMPLGFLKAADSDILAAYATAVAQHNLAAQIVAIEGIYQNGKPHPLLRVQKEAASMMSKLARELGLSPWARDRITFPKPAPPPSPMAALLNGGKGIEKENNDE